ncbi:MAG: BMP family ABC transporter substrate-binding protein [Acutalibacteraceae bacterium]
MKRLTAFFLAFILIFIFTGCANRKDITSSENASSENRGEITNAPAGDRLFVISGDSSQTDCSEGLALHYQNTLKQAESFAESSGMDFESITSSKDRAVSDIVSCAINGASVIVCVGRQFSEAVRQCSQSYTYIDFILFDGMIAEGDTPDNVLQISFFVEEIGFIYGYALARSNITNIGFLAERKDGETEKFLSGAALGAQTFAAEKAAAAAESDNAVSPNAKAAKITITEIYTENMSENELTELLDERKEKKYMRIICLGEKQVKAVAEYGTDFTVLSDCSYDYKNLAAYFEISGSYDITSELELTVTAGDGWAETYGKRTVNLTLEDGYLTVPSFKLSKTFLNAALALLADLPAEAFEADLDKYAYVTVSE